MDGKVTTDFNNTTDYANSIVIQGDKIIVAGYSYNLVNGTFDFALARYTTDGRLDSSFGENGKLTTDFNGSYDQANSIVIRGDKIIAAGYTGDYPDYHFALVGYTTDGRLDSSFGVNGKLTTEISFRDDRATSIVLQGDKILVGGIAYDSGEENYGFALVRYTPDGKLDASFGENGIVTTNLYGSFRSTTSIALQEDKIVAAGDHNGDFALTRYKADGALDSSFGENGIMITDLNNDSWDHVTSMALQGDKIIAVGYTGNSVENTQGFALVRYMADGALDASFGMNGKVISGLGGNDLLQAATLHENRLYGVGTLSSEDGNNYGIVAAYQLETPTPPEPTISIADVTVCESQKYAVLTVHLSAPSTQVVQVDYHTHYITAYPTQDYLGTKWTLQFAAGTTTATIKIPIVNDTICEPTEQFEVLLSNPQNATLLDSIAIVTIKDDDIRH